MSFTYLIGWSKLDVWYYGCRYSKECSPSDLWTTYFTSSEVVTAFRSQHGEPDVIQIRRVFSTPELALRCEDRVLRLVNAVSSPRWLNRAIRGKGVYFESQTDESNRKRSETLKGRKKTSEWKEKISKGHKGKKKSYVSSLNSTRFKNTVVVIDIQTNLIRRIDKSDYDPQYHKYVNQGKKNSVESNLKNRNSQLGRKHSFESRELMRQKALIREEKKRNQSVRS